VRNCARAQGPIRRGGRFEKCWSMTLRNNNSLWLWVPAFAGTTA
jgi:hypothetical protein